MIPPFLRALLGPSLQRLLALALLAVLLAGGAVASLGLYWLAMRQRVSPCLTV